MAKKRLPSISIVTATYDGSYGVLDECLRLVREQNYPQDKIEIVLGHGGSKKKIDSIAKKYDARVIIIPPDKQNAEYNRGVAFNKARNELALILDNDNFLPYKNWMRDMVEPFLVHPDLVAAETCFYHYDKSFSLLDRYFALFGTSEPLPYYLGKADRMPWGTKEWISRGDAKDCGNYYLVEFEPDIQKIPTIGTNGCLMRKKLVTDNADVSPEHHYPIDVMVEVIKSGHNKFAFVKNSIIHKSGYTGFLTFLKRRYKFADEYHFRDYSKRRYSVYTKADFWPVVKYVFYSLTIIGPTLDALKGFMRIPDFAWFLQPIMALGTTVIYGVMTIKNILSGFNSKNSNNLETKSLSKKTNKSVLIFSICYLPNIGGVETHLKDLENELVKRKWKVFVLTYQPLNTPVLGKWIEKRKNVIVYRLPTIRGIFYKLVNKPFLEFLFLFPLQFLALPIILLKHREIDTINAQGIVSGFTASIWARVFGKRYVVAAQSIYDFPTSGPYHLAAKWIFKSADKVLVQSTKSQDEVMSLGVSRDKTKIFTHWEDTKNFRSLDKKKSKKKIGFENKFVVSFFGRLIDKKGVSPLLKAVATINPKVTLAIYGEGPLKPDVQKVAKKNENVVFMGIISPKNLPLHYNAADIVIMPSTHEEGFGRVASGALLCGTPMIVSNRGELPNVVDSEVGEVIEVTPKNIASSINKLFSNRKLLKQKAMKARPYALKRFGENNVKDIIETYL